MREALEEIQFLIDEGELFTRIFTMIMWLILKRERPL